MTDYGAFLTSNATARVCQPLPDARQRASVSGSRRRVVESFGAADKGRPMRGLTACHSASVNGIASGSDMAAAVISASSSGVGLKCPGLSFGNVGHLFGWVEGVAHGIYCMSIKSGKQ